MNTPTKPTTKAPNWRDFERSNEGVKGAAALKIELNLIRIKVGFNPRDLNKPETQEKIERIKESYKAGRYVPPIDVMLGGSDYVDVVDGHCRYEAAVRADTEMRANGGEGLQALTCIPFKGNDAEAIRHTIIAAEGEKLLPIEIATQVKALTNMGWDANKIAEFFSYSVGWVNKLLFMSAMPEEIKGMVLNQEVSADVAVSVLKSSEAPATAVDTLKGLIAEANPPAVEVVDAPKPDGEWVAPRPVTLTPKVKVTSKDLKKKAVPKKNTLDVDVFVETRLMALALPDLPSEALLDKDGEYPIVLKGKIVAHLYLLKQMFLGTLE